MDSPPLTPEQYQRDHVNTVLGVLGLRAELRVLHAAVKELSKRVDATDIPALSDPAAFQAESMKELRKILESVGERNPKLAKAVFEAVKVAGGKISDPDGIFS